MTEGATVQDEDRLRLDRIEAKLDALVEFCRRLEQMFENVRRGNGVLASMLGLGVARKGSR